MKILKKAPTWEPRQVTCQGGERSCGTVLEIEFSDLQRIHHEGDPRDQREQSWDQIFVTCPECRRTIDVRGVPQHLVEKVPVRP